MIKYRLQDWDRKIYGVCWMEAAETCCYSLTAAIHRKK